MASNPDNLVLFHLDEGHDVQANVIAGIVITYVASIVSVVLRLWSRRLTKASFGWDDWLVLLALTICSTQFGIACWWLALNGGKDIGDVSAHKLRKILAILFITEIFYVASLCLVRASALVLWPRIFVGKRVQTYCWVWRVINILLAISAIIVACLQCVPIRLFFEPLDPAYSTSCHVDLKKWWVGTAASGIVIDLAIIALPLVLCARLQLNRTMKVALIALLATGLLATVCSGIRLYYLLIDAFDEGLNPYEKLNLTWIYGYIGMWTQVEMYISVVAACLPCLKPVVAKVVPGAWVPRALQKSSDRGAYGDRRQLDGSTLPGSMSMPSKGSRSGDALSSSGKEQVSDEESVLPHAAAGSLRTEGWEYAPAARQTHIRTGSPGNQTSRQGILVEENFQVRVEKDDSIPGLAH